MAPLDEHGVARGGLKAGQRPGPAGTERSDPEGGRARRASPNSNGQELQPASLLEYSIADHVLAGYAPEIRHDEAGRGRIPVSALPVVARLMQVPRESSSAGRVKRGPMSQLEHSIERIGELPKQKQKFVMEMLETVLAQANA